MKNKRLLLLLLLPLLCAAGAKGQTGHTVKVACIGASITHGATLEHPERDAFPQQLGRLLGHGYQVTNYGVSGAALLKKGELSYWNTEAYRAALKSLPDIVFIDLGGNDAKWINRVHIDEFEGDYHDMIRSFAELSSHPRIILLLPLPGFTKDTAQIWDPAIVSVIIPHIRQVAYEERLEVLDMHSLFVDKEGWMPDKIHPNLEGTTLMAKRLYDLLTEPADTSFDLFKGLSPEKTVGSFYGYPCADFTLNGRDCKVVQPKRAAPGHPWVWRARFWGHEPQTDVALLERGYHIAYCDVAELFGNAEAISRWNDFYHLLHKAGLAKKAVMEGMSRGGVYVFNWAAVNPRKVACVYVDNPVLDLKSWPGGLGKLPPSVGELETLEKDYGLADTAALRQFKGSPVDKVARIVKGRYPILILCADEDEAVAPSENTLLFEQRVRALQGDITVIHKPGFKHHPHSLPNPTPIVDFIIKAESAL